MVSVYVAAKQLYCCRLHVLSLMALLFYFATGIRNSRMIQRQ